MEKSRIPKFYQCSIQDRLRILRQRNIISNESYKCLTAGKQILCSEEADKMIENVIGIFGFSFGLGLNFLINGKDYIVPMVVEEPSIIAAVSSAAKEARNAGGIKSTSTEPILIGQIQIVDVEDTSKAQHAILQNKNDILKLANILHPKMVARGGGARDIEVIVHSTTSHKGDMIIVHLLVDTRDAMGANIVNSMCEGVASLVEKIAKGKVFLRILSNLTDRSMVRANVVFPVKQLNGKGYSGEMVRDGIILASEFASVDTYRAATNNKGIMNGIDAVAIATGNDWRAIEAAAHAYAARGHTYTSLTKWYKNDDGDLAGTIEIPLKVGTVGGPLQSNPAVKIAHEIISVSSAKELAEVMGAVGLAQNFSALRALSTEGVQRGHMTLHARSVVMTAGATPEIFDSVTEQLIESGEIKIWKAEEIIKNMRKSHRIKKELVASEVETKTDLGKGNGKVIMFGEHAVVYGSHAIASSIPITIQAKVVNLKSNGGIHLVIPRWGIEEKLRKNADHKYSIYESLYLILEKLGLSDIDARIEIFPQIPIAMGLGSSAALAVAIIRALSLHFNLKYTDEEVNSLAYESEKVIHGTTSGIDNTLATYGRFVLFKRVEPSKMEEIDVPEPIPLVIGLTGVTSLTAKMVTNVRSAWEKNKSLYERLFNEINELALEAVQAIQAYDLEKLGELMNINQGLLNALQVSSRELEEMNEIARNAGALGAKLTGAGGGGAMIALCPENANQVADALGAAGYEAMITEVG